MGETGLIAGCRRGDRDAQRRVYELYADRIYRLTLRLSGSEHDAFDLTQETFLRAFERFATFGGRADIGTWLYRIASNEAAQLFRRRATERRHRRPLAEHAARSRGPSEAGTRLDVDEALAQLAEEHRTVLVLKYQEGLSYDEIAAVLDCPPGTVASRLNRARAALRAVMEEHGPATHPNGQEASGAAAPGGS